MVDRRSLLAVAAAVGLWLVLKPADERADAPDELSTRTPRVPQGRSLSPPPPLPAAATERRAAIAARGARPVPEVVGPHPDDPHEPGMLPHPMDEAHERIDAENRLILRLNDAMSFRKVKEMREMIVEYRKLDPTDTDANQAGYAVIADCIEHPGEASLAAAHQFYDTQRHSPLRRFVRRICFESSN